MVNKPNWMPVYPCDNCDLKQIDAYGCVYNLTCDRLPDYLSSKSAQKKLLEHLIENSYLVQPVEGKAYRVTNHHTLKSILKQLEVQNANNNTTEML